MIKQVWVEGQGKRSVFYIKIGDEQRRTRFTLEISGDSIHYHRARSRISPLKKGTLTVRTPAAHMTMQELGGLFEALIEAHLDYEVLVDEAQVIHFASRFSIHRNKRERRVIIEEKSKLDSSSRKRGQ